LRIMRPTIHWVIGVGAKDLVGRVGIVDAIVGSNQHVPSALTGRRFLRAPRDNGAKVHGSKVDLHVEPLQKIHPCRWECNRVSGGDYCPPLGSAWGRGAQWCGSGATRTVVGSAPSRFRG